MPRVVPLVCCLLPLTALADGPPRPPTGTAVARAGDLGRIGQVMSVVATADEKHLLVIGRNGGALLDARTLDRRQHIYRPFTPDAFVETPDGSRAILLACTAFLFTPGSNAEPPEFQCDDGHSARSCFTKVTFARKSAEAWFTCANGTIERRSTVDGRRLAVSAGQNLAVDGTVPVWTNSELAEDPTKPRGLRYKSIAKGDWLRSVGLQDGDLLQQVNDVVITDLDSAFLAKSELLNGPATLIVLRDGKRLTFRSKSAAPDGQ